MDSSKRAGPDSNPDRYELIELRGRGGEGELWYSTTTILGDQRLPVALKIVGPSPGSSVEETTSRLHEQAELLRSIDHPGIAKAREAFSGASPHGEGMADQATRTSYFVMNWVSGENLEASVVNAQRHDFSTSMGILTGICATVNHLHQGNATGGIPILHRDIKPANVIINNGQSTLVDFGLVRLQTHNATSISGSTNYMAPELLAGAPPTVASDRFGVGATAFFMLTSSNPNMGDLDGMRSKIIGLEGLLYPAEFADTLLSMLNPDPARRPLNLIEWAARLEALATTTDLNASAATLIGGAGATIGVTGTRIGLPPIVQNPSPGFPAHAPHQVPVSQNPTYSSLPTVVNAPNPSPPPPTNDPQPKSQRKKSKTPLILVGAAVIVLASVAGAVIYVGNDSKENTNNSAIKKPTSTSSSTSSTTTTTTTTTPDPDPTGTGLGSNPVWLSELDEISGDVTAGGVMSQGTFLSNAFTMTSYSPPAKVEYQIDGKFNSLKGIIGTSNQSPSDATFLVEITDSSTGTLLWSEPFSLSTIFRDQNIPMTGVMRIKIEVTRTNPVIEYRASRGIAAFALQLVPPNIEN